MSFYGFASLVGGAYGPGVEILNDVQSIDLTICSREVIGQLKFCKIR